MKRARSFATRSSPRNKENNPGKEVSVVNRMQNSRSVNGNGESPTEFVSPMNYKESNDSVRVTRSSKKISSVESDTNYKSSEDATDYNSVKGYSTSKYSGLKNIAKPEFENTDEEKEIKPELTSTVEESNFNGRRTRSSPRFSSQVVKAKPEIQATRRIKLPRKNKPKASEYENGDNVGITQQSSSDSTVGILENELNVISRPPTPVNGVGLTNFGEISTFDLLNDSQVLKQSLMYLNRIQEKINKETKDRLLMPPPPPKDKKPKRSETEKLEKMKAFVESNRTRPSKNNFDFTDLVSENEKESNSYPLVHELMSRLNQKDNSDGDIICNNLPRDSSLSGFYPDYEQNNADYMEHSRLVKGLTCPQLEEHFNAIRDDIKEIFDGKSESIRNNIFLKGLADARKELQELNVSIPFNHVQGHVLISYLYAFLIPDMKDRSKYSDYIALVMLPEAYIRVYARVSGLSYQKAELEMRFGACYDD